MAFIDRLAAVDGLIARKDALEERLLRIAQDDRLWPTVARLRCFRGIDTLTALTVHLELGGDWDRFSSPRKLFAWLGLTPTLDQSGQPKTQGSITKTGYDRSPAAGRVRLAPPRIGATLQNRQQGQPDHVLQIAWRANTAFTANTPGYASAASRTTSRPSRSPASSPGSSGPPPPHHDPRLTAIVRSEVAPGHGRPARANLL